MSYADHEYLRLVEKILKEGEKREDRTGTGTISLFGPQMEFDLQKGFPLLTTKKLSFRIIAEELFWFLSGSSDLKDLLDRNVNIWNADAFRDYKQFSQSQTKLNYDEFVEHAREFGYDLGPIYGNQWRGRDVIDDRTLFNQPKPDQISNVIKSIRNNPYSRRHIVSAWNVQDIDDMTLPPCHTMFQFYVSNDNKLNCKLYQRSGDVFLGVPYNIASYALLTHLIAKMTDLEVGVFIHSLGDAHIYSNHVQQLQTQLGRTPKNAPSLHISKKHEYIEDYNIQDYILTGYNPHGPIKGDLSVG